MDPRRKTGKNRNGRETNQLYFVGDPRRKTGKNRNFGSIDILSPCIDPRRKTGKNRNGMCDSRSAILSIPVARRGRIETYWCEHFILQH